MKLIKATKKLMCFAVILILPCIARAVEFTQPIVFSNNSSQIFNVVVNGTCVNTNIMHDIKPLVTTKLFQNLLNNLCKNAESTCPMELHVSDCSGDLISTITLNATEGISTFTPPSSGYTFTTSGYNLTIS